MPPANQFIWHVLRAEKSALIETRWPLRKALIRVLNVILGFLMGWGFVWLTNGLVRMILRGLGY
jgi:hypothetical protein